VERVLVAMSGGVDSSVVAGLAKEAGYDVVGVTLRLWDTPDDGSVHGRCCAPEDVHDARRVAAHLGIPHYAFDRRDRFVRHIVEPFVEAYLAGLTPSPCVTCNKTIKVRELLDLADKLNASRVATGHYARITTDSGEPRLWRGVDRSKDQSYFLHMLEPESLRRLVLPLGDRTKREVRELATVWGLPGARKGESQELCFVQASRYADFVASKARHRLRPGPVVDGTGRRVARHSGIHAFTVGQRKNLGIALGYKAYVTEIDPATATVRVGPRDHVLFRAADLRELVLAPDVELPRHAEVAVRYRGRPHRGWVTRCGPGQGTVAFSEPVAAVVAGQYAVLFDRDRVLGGGRIERATRQCEDVS
jgi:tRNA-specific 2-thiouridylase